MASYEIDKVIGKGQFSIVYRAKCINNGRFVALKKVFIEKMKGVMEREDCFKEVKLLQQLSHPNIIKYITSFINGDTLDIVLELAELGDLSQMLKVFYDKRRMVMEKTIWQYFVQISRGLNYMHSERILHRDIKPANVFITQGEIVKLGDLGLGRYFSPQTFEAQTLVGTPYYMSPERLKNEAHSFSSDIWSLGCLLYEMATLRTPFELNSLNLEQLIKNIERGDYLPIPSPIYSVKLNELIDLCLRPKSDDRPDITRVYNIAFQCLHAFE